MTDQAHPPLSWEANSPDQFEELIRPVAPDVTITPLERRFHGRVEMIPLPHSGMFLTSLHRSTVTNPHLPYISITVPLVGAFEATVAGKSMSFGVGIAYGHPAGLPFKLRTSAHSGRMLVFNTPADYLDGIRGALVGTGPDSNAGIAQSFSLSTPAGSAFYRRLIRLWARAARGRDHSPMGLLEDEQAVAVALLTAAGALSPENGSTAPQRASRGVRRVEEYIEAHPSAPTGLVDLATVSGMRADTLCRAFRKQHGIGPVTYLRQRRLEAAQRMLLGADPESMTVIRAALKYGFGHMSRFARQYRKTFGELPSDTLAR